jgi:hypothetical protein
MAYYDPREIEKRMQALDDHDLLRLVALEESQYVSGVLEIARTELRRRGLRVLNAEQYWDQFPLERTGSDGFCARCRSETTDESPGDTFTMNFVGTSLIGDSDRCPACGSVVQTKWYRLFIPIIRLGRYRVIYSEKDPFSSRYVGRKLRDTKLNNPNVA